MSRYGYTHRGGYSAYNGGSPQKDDWNKTSYASDDHVCRPVVVDAEGKKRPIVSYGHSHHSTEGYVTKRETIIEHVHPPDVTDYRHSSPTTVYPLEDYSFTEETWHQASSPVHDRPNKVEEFITKVQTHPSRPNKYDNTGATHWRQNYNSTGNHGINGHGEYNGMDNNERHKPSGNRIRDDDYDDHYHQNDSRRKPIMTTTGGWDRPSHGTWSSPPDAPLSKPTNNIDAAVEYLKEAAKPFSSTSTTATAAPHSRYTEPRYSETIDSKKAAKPFSSTSTTTTTAAPHSRYTDPTYSENIDSKEAARRYGNFNFSSPPYSVDESNKPTITSREAMRKYNGAVV